VYYVYLKDYNSTVALIKQIFTNKDGSTWERHLLSTDISLNFDQIASLYKRRWKIEESFKSMKSNTWFAKSPTKTIKSQSNHYFMSIYAYFKLQLLSAKLQLNNFCLKSKLYIQALKASFRELQLLKNWCDFKILA
jgi:IS4 transposase